MFYTIRMYLYRLQYSLLPGAAKCLISLIYPTGAHTFQTIVLKYSYIFIILL